MYYNMKTSLRSAPHLKHDLRVLEPTARRFSLKHDEMQNSPNPPTRKQSSPQQATPLPTLYSIMQPSLGQIRANGSLLRCKVQSPSRCIVKDFAPHIRESQSTYAVSTVSNGRITNHQPPITACAEKLDGHKHSVAAGV